MPSTLYNPLPFSIFDRSGRPANSAKAYFFRGNTTTPLVVYRDAERTTPWTQPVVANGMGVFPSIFLPYETYDVRITNDNGSEELLYTRNIANPAPPEEGGGGGVVVSADEIFRTGDVKFRMDATPVAGWIRLNGETVGNALSGGTEIASDDAEDIFSYLWSNFNNTLCPVSTGRGVSASADFAANKTIQTMDAAGCALVAADAVGAGASNVIQVSGTTRVTNGSPTIVPASLTGLARGMFIIIDGVAAGKIASFSGLTDVVLDTNYAGTTSLSKPFRASFFSDAQLFGSRGGEQSAIQTTTELAIHNHGITDPGHVHGLDIVNGIGAVNGVAIGADSGTDQDTKSKVTGITINNAGLGKPSSIMQPSLLGCYFMKM